eukprot:Protomagalhaensia_wolfi_Nauph_80__171@NODE_1097_length_1737_cov_128_419317_g836_i0_p3_GENE_NODE_1097_length_1737_cov_128_419317_g836_i0NODE_1097_length_1737_cov_128_419317_g836_i0_p3_ORF_typecomplete_len114_score19_60_NODE_1097_length_1737_cov_128_419317_g836_i0198539
MPTSPERRWVAEPNWPARTVSLPPVPQPSASLPQQQQQQPQHDPLKTPVYVRPGTTRVNSLSCGFVPYYPTHTVPLSEAPLRFIRDPAPTQTIYARAISEMERAMTATYKQGA